MSAPTNISALTATSIGTAQTITQRVDDAGTTYTVWYKMLADFDGVVGVWAFGDLVTYKPTHQVFYNDGTTQFMDYKSPDSQGGTNNNLPFLMPITTGITYYIKVIPNVGNPSPANLAISTVPFTSTAMQAGDFINNREFDDAFEHPLTVMSQTSYVSRSFVQMAAPLPGTRSGNGLPHGDQGAILDNGNFLYIDTGFLTGNVYDKLFNVVGHSPNYAGVHSFLIGSNRTSSHFYVAHNASPGGHFTIDELDSVGALTNQVVTTIPAMDCICVNDDASILYYWVTEVIKRWDLVNNIALSDLSGAITGFNAYDLLYLQDQTVLVGLLKATGSAGNFQAMVEQYSTAGSLLHTYDFGQFWRNDLNPIRIGYALDSPASFWARLAPNADHGTDTFKNIKISDGSTISTVNQANYLFGQYIGTATATPPSRFGQEKAGALLVAPLSGAGSADLFIGSETVVPMKRVRRVPLPILPGNARQTLGRVELQFQAGAGLAVDSAAAPQYVLAVSFNSGQTFGTARQMSAGLEGQFYARAYANALGTGRFPVLDISCTDDFNSVLTDVMVTMEPQTG
jgi:hypothetical protein